MARYQHRSHEQPLSLSGALTGALAGAAAVWAMDRIDWFMFNSESPRTRRRTRSARPGGLDPAHVLANEIAHLLGVRLSPRQPHPAGIAVHYAIGMLPAALYGAARDQMPELTAGRGAAFGLLIFLLEDELLNPMAGLAGMPGEYPWQDHARGLIAHVAFGLVLDSLLRALDNQGPGQSRGAHRGHYPSRGYDPALRPERSGDFGQAL